MMNREQQEKAKIKALVVAQSGAEQIETLVRMCAIMDVTGEQLNTAITAIARRAFANGMISLSENQDATYSPEARFHDWLNKRPDKTRN
jgi:hypothetical protein